MVPLATSPRRTDGRPAVPWSWKTTGFATAPWGRAQPVVFHDQSGGIAARRKTPQTKRAPEPPRRERIFPLDKENPIQGRVRGLGEWPHPFNYSANPSDDYVFRPNSRAIQTVRLLAPAPHPALYEVFFVKRKICVVSGPGRRVG